MERLAVHGDQRLLADLRVRLEAELLLGGFGGPPQARQRQRMLRADTHAVPFVELGLQLLQQEIVEIVAAQVVVAVAGQHFGDIALHHDHRNVEGAAAQVVHHHGAARAVAEAVGQAGGGRLVENPHHFQPGHHARFARGIALRVGEVRGHRDHGAFHRLLQIAAGPLGQFAQDQRGDLLRRETFVAQQYGLGAAHPALDAAHGAVRIDQLLIARGFAHQQFAGRRDTHARRQHLDVARPQHAHLAIHERRYFRIGGA